MKHKHLLFFIILTYLFSLFVFVYSSPSSEVVLVEINETITPATADLIDEVITYAEEGRASAVILVLNTFGGSVDPTYKIIERIQTSNVPVIGYVYPTGAKALSAGTYILMACNYAAMAPYTTIGAGQPVLGFEPTNETKFVNPLKEEIKTLAKMHRRNVTQAERFVTYNDVLDAEGALKTNVIEAIASTPEELLKIADGSEVIVNGRKIILDLVGKEIMRYQPSLRIHFLRAISDPMINAILFTIGILAIIFGLTLPGYGSEVIGIVLIILSLMGQGFNVDVLAIGALVLGAILLFIEIHTPGFGILGGSGIVLLAIGLIILVTKPFTVTLVAEEFVRSITIATLTLIALLATFFSFVVYKAYKAIKAKKRLKPYPEGIGRTIDEISPDKEGYIVIGGEYWKARSQKGIIPADIKVEIIGFEDGVLIVRKKD